MPQECNCNYDYILLSTMKYEGPWIHGVVHSLKEANEYFKKKFTHNKSFTDYVSVWNGTKRVCTYTYNKDIGKLEKDPLTIGEVDYSCLCDK